MAVKAFYKTSEWWVSVIAMLIAGTVVVMEVHAGKLDSMGALGVIGAAVAMFYTSKRKAAKSEDKPIPPSVPPAALLLLTLALATGCVVNVPTEVADSARALRQDFGVYRSLVIPADVAGSVTATKTQLLGVAIEQNLSLLEELAVKGSR